nr:MAG TPA: hypothetical protein [Caudoviricetes sp.]
MNIFTWLQCLFSPNLQHCHTKAIIIIVEGV